MAQETGGVGITIDPIGMGPAERITTRETYRVVGGLEGTFSNGWTFEVAANYGRFDQSVENSNEIIVDRFLSAIDAVTDPATGQPACRSSVDPSAPVVATPFDIPVFDPGYYSFTPGDGSCVPLNIWAGQPGISQQAVDWITRQTSLDTSIEQTVFSAYLSGNSENYFALPAGPIDFAAGVEWREEKSSLEWDSFARGELPAGAPFPAGTNVADISNNSSLLFRPALSNRNEVGEYDAADVFIEINAPLLEGVFLAESLDLDAAVRASDYSTIGSTFTWKTGLS